MHILFITGDFTKFLVAETHHLLNALKRKAKVTQWHHPGNIHDIISRLEEQPDFVFVNEFGETNCPVITGLESLHLPFAIYVYDIHYNYEQRNEEMKRIQVKHVFTHYRDRFLDFYPEFVPCMHWLPQHVDTELFYDYKQPKDIDMLLMGNAYPYIYPLRHKIAETFKEWPNFVQHPHPGYRNIEEHERKQVLVREDYAREINRAKLFFTCDSIFHYPIAKYFEVPACNTLLLAPAVNELADLGFVPGEHYVDINENNFVEKALYYLRHEEERARISRNGCELVQARHSSTKRAEQLLQAIEQIIRQS